MNHVFGLASVGSRKMKRAMGFGILVAAALAMPASAETILIDDFNDGNDDGWDHLDFIADQPFGPARYDASSGEYRMASAGLVTDLEGVRNSTIATLWAASSDPLYSNGLLRTRFRITRDATSFALGMRINANRNGEFTFYSFGAASFDTGFPNPSGPNPGGVFFFDRFEAA